MAVESQALRTAMLIVKSALNVGLGCFIRMLLQQRYSGICVERLSLPIYKVCADHLRLHLDD